jgi:GTP-binding protein HflX
VVNDTLAEIGAAEKPLLLVFNKIDQYRPDEIPADDFAAEMAEEDRETNARPPLAQLQATYMAKLHDPVVFVSAQSRENLDELRQLLGRRVAALHQQRYPYETVSTDEAE